MNTEHARISPSKIKQFIECLASFYFNETLPPLPTTNKAADGTKAHKVADGAVVCYLNNLDEPNLYLRQAPSLSPTIQGNEMQFYAEEYVDYIRDHLESYLIDPEYDVATFTEKKVSYNDNCWGTADFVAMVRKPGSPVNVIDELHVFDYKYGYSIVNAVENYQLLTYAMCIKETLAMKHVSILRYVLHIFQPRARVEDIPQQDDFDYIVEYTAEEAERYFDKIKETISILTTTPLEEIQKLPCKSGDHCRYCAGRGVCKVLNGELATDLADMFKKVAENSEVSPRGKILTPNISVLSKNQMAYLVLNKSRIIDMLDSLTSSVTNLLLNGAEIEGVKLIEAKKNRELIDDVELVEASLIDLGMENPCTIKKVLPSLTAIEKVLGKGSIDHLLKNRSDEPPTYKVVSIDAKGEPVNPSANKAEVFMDMFKNN